MDKTYNDVSHVSCDHKRDEYICDITHPEETIEGVISISSTETIKNISIRENNNISVDIYSDGSVVLLVREGKVTCDIFIDNLLGEKTLGCLQDGD